MCGVVLGGRFNKGVTMKAIDLSGQTFGNLTVESRVENTKSGSAQWRCRCSCGNTVIATTSILRSGNKKSCGCKAKHDLTGRRFGKLTVIREMPVHPGRQKVTWECRCDCGETAECTTTNLLSGKSMSCGCVRTKHNGKGTRLYRILTGMKDRCHNKRSAYYRRYGGRGIIVCDEWKNDFAKFRAWAKANGYQENLTIDRIDNDGNYEPSNCQWLTLEENARKNNA